MAGGQDTAMDVEAGDFGHEIHIGEVDGGFRWEGGECVSEIFKAVGCEENGVDAFGSAEEAA